MFHTIEILFANFRKFAKNQIFHTAEKANGSCIVSDYDMQMLMTFISNKYHINIDQTKPSKN